MLSGVGNDFRVVAGLHQESAVSSFLFAELIDMLTDGVGQDVHS